MKNPNEDVFSQTPLRYIKEISLSNVFVASDNSANEFPTIDPQTFLNFLPQEDVKTLRADNVLIQTPDAGFQLSDISANLNDQGADISGIWNLDPKNDIDLNVQISRAQTRNALAVNWTAFSNGELELKIAADGIARSKETDQTIKIEKAAFGDFEIDHLEGKMLMTDKTFSLNLKGEAANINIKLDDKTLSAQALIHALKINKHIDSTLKASLELEKGKSAKLYLETDDFSLYGFDFGAFKSEISKEGELYAIRHKYGSNNELRAAYLKNSHLNFSLIANGIAAGGGGINLSGKTALVDIRNISLKDVPFIPFAKDKPAGNISVRGSINEKNGRIALRVDNFETSKISKMDVFGFFEKTNEGALSVDIESSGDFIVFKGIVKDGVFSSIDFIFKQADADKMLKAFGIYNVDIKGTAGGRVNYKRGLTIDADIMAVDGYFYGNEYSSMRLKALATPDTIDIENFLLTDKSGAVLAKIEGDLGFTNANPVSFLDIELNGFYISNAPISAKLFFRGELDGGSEINGFIRGAGFEIMGVSFPEISAKAAISKSRLYISNLKAQNGLTGIFEYIVQDESFDGRLELKGSDISALFNNLSAKADIDIDISGSIGNPIISGAMAIKNAKLLGENFSLKADYLMSANKIEIRNSSVYAGESGRISFDGKYGKSDRLKFAFENAPVSVISKLLGADNLQAQGYISGTAQINRSDMSMRFLIDSSDLTVFGFKMQQAHALISVGKNSVLISSASAKSADSEIRNITGSYRTADGSYNLELQIVNAHLASADIFGKALITGAATVGAGKMIFTGSAVLNDFWINRMRIDKYETEYRLTDKVLTLKHKKDLRYGEMLLDLDFKNMPTIKNFKLTNGAMLFNVSGILHRDNFAINASGKNLDTSVLADILDLTLDFEGSADLFFESAGSFRNPRLRFSLNSAKGSAMLIPYDYADIEVEVANNKAQIKTARLYKKDEINISLTGEFPFWLDETVRPSLGKVPINISYSLQDSKLYILGYLSEGFVKSRGGTLLLKGTVSGNLDNVRNSGRLTVSNGAVDMSSYLEKLRNIEIDIAWNENQIEISEFTAKAGSGQINISGGAQINFLDIEEMNIRLFSSGKGGVPVNVPYLPISTRLFKDISKGRPTFDITIKGSIDNPKIEGRIVLENTRFNFAPDEGGDGSEFFESAQYNIDIVSGRNTRFENSFLNTLINGGINISGIYPDIKVNGTIEGQNGDLLYAGLNFDIISSKIEIIDNEIFVSGSADKSVYNHSTGMTDMMRMTIERSSIEDLQMKFSSKDDPNMDSRTAYAKIIGVQASEADDPNAVLERNTSETALRQTAFRIFDSNIITPLARTVVRKTGIVDNVRVSYVQTDSQKRKTGAATNSADSFPDAASQANAPADSDISSVLYGTKYSFEKNITRSFALGYSLVFDRLNVNNTANTEAASEEMSIRHEVDMRYRLSNNLFLIGTYELDVSEAYIYQPDRRIMLQQQFWFGGHRKRN